MVNEEDPFEPELLGAWQPVDPASDFATQVVAASQAERSSAKPRWPWLAAAAASILLLIGVTQLHLPATGSVVASGRQTLALGHRGTAVAEAGAAVDWEVGASGRARIAQRSGNVFYRVERGGPFVVSTPLGEVEVKGTCFRVEVDKMGLTKGSLSAAGVGALAASALLVTVYEGRVLLASERGKAEVAAGQQASLRAGEMAMVHDSLQAGDKAPATNVATTLLAPGETREQLLARVAAEQAELVRLRKQMQDLEAEKSSKLDPNSLDHPFYAPSQAELLQMAKECKLSWDDPSLGTRATIPMKQARKVGLTAEEIDQAQRTTAEFNKQYVADLKKFYTEVGGEKTVADTIDPANLWWEISQKTDQTEMRQIYQRMAQERAGLAQPSVSSEGQSPTERMMRRVLKAGDDYEAVVGQAIGPDLAHKLRDKGWGSRHNSSYGCPGEEDE